MVGKSSGPHWKWGVVAAAVALAAPSTALADPAAGGGAGVYVSFTFGKQLGIGYGLELQVSAILRGAFDCTDNGLPAGVGGVFQVGGINGETLRLVGAVQGGGWVPSPPSLATGLTGELGVAGHIGKNPGVGFHTGFLVDTPIFMNAFVRAEWFLQEYSVGLGARMLPTYWSALGERCPS